VPWFNASRSVYADRFRFIKVVKTAMKRFVVVWDVGFSYVVYLPIQFLFFLLYLLSPPLKYLSEYELNTHGYFGVFS
jgi:hypothetical protein